MSDPAHPAGPHGLNRRKLLLAAAGGAVLLGGGAAVVLSGGKAGSGPKPPPGAGSPPPEQQTPSGTSVRQLVLAGADATAAWTATFDVKKPPPSILDSSDGLTVADGAVISISYYGITAYDTATGRPLWPAPVRMTGLSGVGGQLLAAGTVVYAAGRTASGKDVLAAVDSTTGTVAWSAELPEPAWQAQRVAGASNGIVYVTGSASTDAEGFSDSGFIWAFDTIRRQEAWRATGKDIGAVLVPSGRGPVLTGTQVDGSTGRLQTYDAATGAKGWEHTIPNCAPDFARRDTQAFCLAGGHFVYGATDQLYALDPETGAEAWTYPTAGGVYGPPFERPTAGSDGNTVLVDDRRTLYAFDARTGAQRWLVAGPKRGFTPLAIPCCANGVFYIQGEDGTLWAVNLADGTTRWKYAPTPAPSYGNWGRFVVDGKRAYLTTGTTLTAIGSGVN
ncbi:PQQ-binding-like beta-propeller repeat protein [Kitasatospora sp. NPDC056446]|uniref:outer membrane protein assembly factor BamB family protein n=1 Tax=Kitasatospora sp. NPDC056446 TaxID=3345819 RepID=UPI00367A8647